VHRLLVAILALAVLVSASGTVFSAFSATARSDGSRWRAAAVFAPAETALDPPRALEPPAVSGLPAAGETLTATRGVWSGAPTRYAHRWERCRDAACHAIAGAVEQTYALTSDDAGATIRVAVTATNGAGGATATSAPTATVTPADMELPLTGAEATVPAWAPHAPQLAIDGDPATYFQAAARAAPGHSFTVDLGRTRTVTGYRVRYGWVPAFAVAVSEDGARWTDAGVPERARGTAVGGGAHVTHRLASPVQARYLRLTVTAEGREWWTLDELRPLGPPAAPQALRDPRVVGLPASGATVHADRGRWLTDGAASTTVDWQRCDAGGERCASTGATGTDYTVTDADRAAGALRVRVTVAGAGGSTTATSALSPVAASPLAVTYDRAVEADDPVSFHPLTGGTAGTGPALTAHAAPFTATWRDGISTAAALRDGGHLALAANPVAGETAWTIEGWFRTDGEPAPWSRYWDLGDDHEVARNRNSFWMLSPRSGDTGELVLMAQTAGAREDLRMPRLPAGAWHHIVVTQDAERVVRVHVNGALHGARTFARTMASVGAQPDAWIGRSQYPHDPAFRGAVTGLATYARALSAAEIQAHHDAAVASGRGG